MQMDFIKRLNKELLIGGKENKDEEGTKNEK